MRRFIKQNQIKKAAAACGKDRGFMNFGITAEETAQQFCRAWFELCDADKAADFLEEDVSLLGPARRSWPLGRSI